LAFRVTAPEVEEILENADSLDLTPFIRAANVTITSVLTGRGLSTAQLKEIERWLTAHFASIRDRLASEEDMGDASIVYEGRHGMGLDHTSYGQMVKILDTSGILAEAGMQRAQFAIISKNELP